VRRSFFSLVCLGALFVGDLGARETEGLAFALDEASRSVVAEAGDPNVLWLQDRSGEVVSLEEDSPRDDAGAHLDLDLLVLSASAGTPLPGALFWFGEELEGFPLVEVSAARADGRGRIRAAVPERAWVRVWAPEHGTRQLRTDELARRRELVLPPGGPVVLEVSADGEPAPGVELRYDFGTFIPISSDAQGRFEIPGVAEPLRIEVVDERFAFTSLRFEAGEHRLDLKPAAVLVGEVKGPGDAPLAEARVSVLVQSPEEPNHLRRMETTADAAGAFRLGGLPPGTHLTRWRLDGHGTRQEWLSFTAGRETRAPRMVLQKVPLHRLRVSGPEGPIASAAAVDPVSGERWEAGPEGLVELEGHVASPGRPLRIEAEDHLPREIELPEKPEGPIEVRLERGNALAFLLRSLETHEPVTEVAGEIEQEGGVRFTRREHPEGKFQFAALDGGALRLTLRSPGFLPLDLRVEPAGERTDLGTLFLERGASIEGALYDARTGAPLVGARISSPASHRWGRLAARRFRDDPSAATDSEGRFRLAGLEGGSLCLVVEHPNVAPVVSNVDPPLEPHERRALPMQILGPGVAVSGEVIDGRGKPLGGIGVELRVGPLHSPCLRMAARSDAEGRFDFTGVGPGTYRLIALRQHRVEAAKALEIEAGHDVEGLVLELAQTCFSGQVRVGGLPATEGVVAIEPPASDEFLPVPVFMERGGLGVPPGQEVLSDLPGGLSMAVGGDGRFSGCAALEPGPARAAYRPAYDGTVYRQPLELHGSDEVELDLAFDGVELAGRVVGPEGEGAAGVLIGASLGGFELRGTASGPGGAFRLAEVPSGEVEILAKTADARARLRLGVGTDSRDGLELILRPEDSAEIVLALADADGQPVPGALVYLTDGRGTHRFERSGNDGRARFGGLEGRHYRTLVMTPAGGLAEGPEITVSAGVSHEHPIELETPALVELHLGEDMLGERLGLRTAAGVSTRPLLGYAGVELWVGPAGRLRLPPLAEGSWQIEDASGTVLETLLAEDGEELIDLR